MDRIAAGQQVRAALSAVVEPELGRPITDLGFVSDVSIDDRRVHVRLRVPSFFQLHRHGWLILADARAALGVLPWAEAVDLCFADDGTGGRIAVGAPSHDADAASDGQRSDLRRAAFRDRQLDLLHSLLERGLRRGEIWALTVADLPVTATSAVYLQRRAEMLLPTDARAPLLVHEDGRPVAAGEIDDYLARLRVTTATD
jgi:metal-sulfur cluster biosynthetic enzyme